MAGSSAGRFPVGDVAGPATVAVAVAVAAAGSDRGVVACDGFDPFGYPREQVVGVDPADEHAYAAEGVAVGEVSAAEEHAAACAFVGVVVADASENHKMSDG